MRTKSRTLVATIALGALGFAQQVSADTTTQAISGSQSAQENGCVDAIGIFTANDCSYNGKLRWVGDFAPTYVPDLTTLTQADVTPPIYVDAYWVDRTDRAWIGPLANQMYYATGDSPISNSTSPAVGDNKVALGLSGQLSIDDRNTASGADDLISGAIVIAAGTRNVLTGQADNTRVEESWDSLTETLAPTAVDSATANGSGGFDYVIASRGMPDRLQPYGLNDQAYPSEIASSPIVGVGNSGWVAPDSQGRSVATFECIPENPTSVKADWHPRQNRVRVEAIWGADCVDPSSNNIGATTTGEFTGYSCIHSNGGACPRNPAILGVLPSFFTPAGDPGYQNLLIAISTNGAGEIISSNAFYTHQYQVLQGLFGFDTPYEAWDGGDLTLAGTGAAVTASARARPSGGSPDINLKSGGGIPIVLYGNDSLDATQVTDLHFGPSQVGISHSNAHISDENGDGVDDIVGHFKQSETGIVCGDTAAILTGVTGGGLPISATAIINVLGC